MIDAPLYVVSVVVAMICAFMAGRCCGKIDALYAINRVIDRWHEADKMNADMYNLTLDMISEMK